MTGSLPAPLSAGLSHWPPSLTRATTSVRTGHLSCTQRDPFTGDRLAVPMSRADMTVILAANGLSAARPFA